MPYFLYVINNFLGGTQMNKRTVLLNGEVFLPLKIGTNASIFYNGKTFYTTTVTAILKVSYDFIKFETHERIYRVGIPQLPQQMSSQTNTIYCA